KVVLLDATGGTNRYGFTSFAVVVVDEFNNGCLVAPYITSSGVADVLAPFLTAALEAPVSDARLWAARALIVLT
ncbi:hypothetical protein COO60DRAFT_1276506, partial [Scenedesmus sp. NREL 46B-D3]